MRIMYQTYAQENNLTVARAQNVEPKRHEQTASITNRQGGRSFISKNYKVHRNRLKLIRPTMNILPPFEPLFLKERNIHDINTKHLAKEWSRKLLQHKKIIKAIKPDKPLDHRVQKRKQIVRLIPDPQQLKELDNQNKKFYKGLTKINPSYSTQDMKKAYKKHTYLENQISYNAKRCPTISLKRPKRCKSAGGTARGVNTVDQNEAHLATENIPTSRSTRRPQSSIAPGRRNLELRNAEENTDTIQSARLR